MQRPPVVRRGPHVIGRDRVQLFYFERPHLDSMAQVVRRVVRDRNTSRTWLPWYCPCTA